MTVRSASFDTRMMILVSGSRSRRRIPSSIMMPPISGYRSRPPVPMREEMPKPSFSTRQPTSCAPLPDAPTMPTQPG